MATEATSIASPESLAAVRCRGSLTHKPTRRKAAESGKPLYIPLQYVSKMQVRQALQTSSILVQNRLKRLAVGLSDGLLCATSSLRFLVTAAHCDQAAMRTGCL